MNRSSTSPLGICLTATIAPATDNFDATRNLDLAIFPAAPTLLQEGVAIVAPGVPKILRALWRIRDKADCLPPWRRSDVAADEGDALDAVFGPVADILIHVRMMGDCSTVRNGLVAAGPLWAGSGRSTPPQFIVARGFMR
jgi:hypothetical protein